jgi:hypothetical protein
MGEGRFTEYLAAFGKPFFGIRKHTGFICVVGYLGEFAEIAHGKIPDFIAGFEYSFVHHTSIKFIALVFIHPEDFGALEALAITAFRKIHGDKTIIFEG